MRKLLHGRRGQGPGRALRLKQAWAAAALLWNKLIGGSRVGEDGPAARGVKSTSCIHFLNEVVGLCVTALLFDEKIFKF